MKWRVEKEVSIKPVLRRANACGAMFGRVQEGRILFRSPEYFDVGREDNRPYYRLLEVGGGFGTTSNALQDRGPYRYPELRCYVYQSSVKL